VFYVAGGRVVGDPLAQPFSMGRNLFCVHSKKYIDTEEDPDEKSAMSKQNRRTLTEMSKAMKAGGTLIWIAPSGGRDRLQSTPKGERPVPAAFDPDAVEMFRSISSKANKPTHFYPMAMATYSIMPPPSGINKALGEKRVTKFTGCAISLAPRVDLSDDAAWRPAAEEGADAKAMAAKSKVALCDHVFGQVCEEYEMIEKVMADLPFMGYKDQHVEGFVPAKGEQPWKH
jgi:glycerol-3-phosphate O-acyltransferase